MPIVPGLSDRNSEQKIDFCKQNFVMTTSKQCRLLGTTNTKFTNLICQHSKVYEEKDFYFLAAHHVTRSLSLKDRLSSTLQNDMENLRKDQQLRLTFDKGY